MKRLERGATAVEYALIIALCAAVFLVAALALQRVLTESFDRSACDTERGYQCEKS